MSTARCVDCQRWPAAVGSRCATCYERALREGPEKRCLDCGTTSRFARGLCRRCYSRRYQNGTLDEYDTGRQVHTAPDPSAFRPAAVTHAIERRWAAERARVAAYEARRTAEWLAAHAKDEPV